jgi:hypothetical protein
MHEHRIHRLKPNRPASLHVPAGTALVLAKGVAWLTSSAHRRDEVLQPGQKYVAAAAEHLVVEAIGSIAILATRQPQARAEPSGWQSADWVGVQPARA